MSGRSDNLRPAPGFLTPQVVGRVLEQIDQPMVIDAEGIPVVAMTHPKPQLRVVSETSPDEHARRAEEREAADLPHASPPRAKRKLRATAKYPDWTPEEDAQLREVYESEGRVDLLAKTLGRTERAATSRARKLGIMKPRKIKGGWCTSQAWTDEEETFLRENFKKMPTRRIAVELGRSLQAVYCRAHALDLTGQLWSGQHRLALRIAFDRGIAIKDIAIALGRLPLSVSKYATSHGMNFGRRSCLVDPITLDDLLTLADVNVQRPLLKRDLYRPNNPGASGTARKAPGAASSGAAKRGSASAPPICEATHPAPRQGAGSAAPREPAPVPQRTVRPNRPLTPQLARAHSSLADPDERSLFDREAYDRKGARYRAAARKRIEAQAIALLDGDESGRSEGGAISSNVRAVMNQIEERRAAEARHVDPVEKAKLSLQRANYRPVCSMAVYGGEANLYCIGHRKDVTESELIAFAKAHGR